MSMIRNVICVAAVVLQVCAAFAQAPGVDAATPQRVLVANCANCHGTAGNAQGAMPSLAGRPKAYIIEQMQAFRDGKRPSTIMQQLAKGYTDAQVEQIADYFSRQQAAR
jgi:sulfide dehydrogenase cytochrome subunit